MQRILMTSFLLSLPVFFLLLVMNDESCAHGKKSHPVAQDKHAITYTKDIAPLFQEKCARCHGAKSPVHMEFVKDIKKYKAKMKGPRMDTFSHLTSFIVWPDTGALMRVLDDGKNTENAKPGRMYRHLGKTDAEKQRNLKLFKDWVGSWTLKGWNDIEKKDIDSMKLFY